MKSQARPTPNARLTCRMQSKNAAGAIDDDCATGQREDARAGARSPRRRKNVNDHNRTPRASMRRIHNTPTTSSARPSARQNRPADVPIKVVAASRSTTSDHAR